MSRRTTSFSDRLRSLSIPLIAVISLVLLIVGAALGFGLSRLLVNSPSSFPAQAGPNIRAAAQFELPRPAVANAVDNLTLDILPSRALAGLKLAFNSTVEVVPASDLSSNGLHPSASFTPAAGIKALIVAGPNCQVVAKNLLSCPAVPGGQVQTLTLPLIPLFKGSLNVSATLSNTSSPPLAGLDGKTAVVVSFGLTVS